VPFKRKTKRPMMFNTPWITFPPRNTDTIEAGRVTIHSEMMRIRNMGAEREFAQSKGPEVVDKFHSIYRE